MDSKKEMDVIDVWREWNERKLDVPDGVEKIMSVFYDVYKHQIQSRIGGNNIVFDASDITLKVKSKEITKLKNKIYILNKKLDGNEDIILQLKKLSDVVISMHGKLQEMCGEDPFDELFIKSSNTEEWEKKGGIKNV